MVTFSFRTVRAVAWATEPKLSESFELCPAFPISLTCEPLGVGDDRCRVSYLVYSSPFSFNGMSEEYVLNSSLKLYTET